MSDTNKPAGYGHDNQGAAGGTSVGGGKPGVAHTVAADKSAGEGKASTAKTFLIDDQEIDIREGETIFRAAERLDIDTRAGALGGFTPLSHGTAVFYVASGDKNYDGISSPDLVPIPFRVSDNLPEPKALPTHTELRAERAR